MQSFSHLSRSSVTGITTAVTNHDNDVRSETRVTTADEVKAMIGSAHYDDRLSVEKNVVNALVNGFFLAEGEHTLRGLTLEHSLTNPPITAPANVIFDDCFVSGGNVGFLPWQNHGYYEHCKNVGIGT